MYELVYEEMEDAGVVVWIETPDWQDRNGNIFDANNAEGCRVIRDLTHPRNVYRYG